MRYVPNDKKEEIRRKICEDCKYNDGEEQLSCCYCQEGSLFEEKKLSRGNRRKAPIIEQNQTGCSPELRWDCNRDCKSCTCRDCEDRFECDGGNPVTRCGM